MSIKLIKCHKCGAMVISQQEFLQQIIDEIEHCNRKAHKASKAEKGVYIKQAAGYTAMLKGFMHNLTLSETVQRNKSEYILKELRDYVSNNKLVTAEELKRIYDKGAARCNAKRADFEREMNRIYGDFETACNRTKASPTERDALSNTH